MPYDTNLQPRPVCPHCGYKHDDAEEWNFGFGLYGLSEGRTCYECEGEFDCRRGGTVYYTTSVGERKP